MSEFFNIRTLIIEAMQEFPRTCWPKLNKMAKGCDHLLAALTAMATEYGRLHRHYSGGDY